MNNWIRVTDRLPPPNSAVRLYNQDTGDMWLGALCLYDSELRWCDSKSYVRWDDKSTRWDGNFFTSLKDAPSHWKPLGKPPSKYPSADRVYP